MAVRTVAFLDAQRLDRVVPAVAKVIGDLSTEKHHLSGEIPHHFCIFNGKIPQKMEHILQFAKFKNCNIDENSELQYICQFAVPGILQVVLGAKIEELVVDRQDDSSFLMQNSSFLNTRFVILNEQIQNASF